VRSPVPSPYARRRKNDEFLELDRHSADFVAAQNRTKRTAAMRRRRGQSIPAIGSFFGECHVQRVFGTIRPRVQILALHNSRREADLFSNHLSDVEQAGRREDTSEDFGLTERVCTVLARRRCGIMSRLALRQYWGDEGFGGCEQVIDQGSSQ
jgi:hypothetical protein